MRARLRPPRDTNGNKFLPPRPPPSELVGKTVVHRLASAAGRLAAISRRRARARATQNWPPKSRPTCVCVDGGRVWLVPAAKSLARHLPPGKHNGRAASPRLTGRNRRVEGARARHASGRLIQSRQQVASARDSDERRPIGQLGQLHLPARSPPRPLACPAGRRSLGIVCVLAVRCANLAAIMKHERPWVRPAPAT